MLTPARALAVLVVASGAVLGGGCARPRVADPVATSRMDRAVTAMERGDHAVAVAELLAVAGTCPATPLGRRALLLAAAAAVDPRNPTRQLDLSALLAARYLATLPADDAGTKPLAETVYLLALELGARQPRIIGCGALAPTSLVAALPQAETPTVPARIGALERELTRLRDELARIRKTLEP